MNQNKTYQGWLNSPSIVKRSLAVWGHMALVQIPITIALVVLAFAIMGAMTANNISSYQQPACTSSNMWDC